MSIKPAVKDGYETSLIVQKAVLALDAFGGDLSHSQARVLLPLWAGFLDLTVPERAAVLARFPHMCPERIGDPGNPGPGW